MQAAAQAPQGATAAAGMGQAVHPSPAPVERLSSAVQQQLNLESVRTRAVGLSKNIARILEDFDAFSRSNIQPKWQDVLGQFSMVNMELFKIVEDIKVVSKAFVVYPKNVNADTATILPVMLSSKLLPEMEAEDAGKKDLLLSGMQNLPVPMQIEKIKARIDMIAVACEAAEKIVADARKAYGLGTRTGPSFVQTVDKAHAAKIQEQENLLRAAVNFGEGLRIQSDQRQLPASLPSHLAEVLTFGDGGQNIGDNPGMYTKSTPSYPSTNVNNQGAVMQATGAQLGGRSVPSPSSVSGTTFENASTPPISYANSPRSGANIMNTPSPQQQTPQQQRQKLMQMPQHQQLLAQQQLRQSSSSGVLGQNTMTQLHDLHGQAQQKFQQVPGQHQMQYSQPLAQQFQNRQLQAAHMQHNMPQSQINQGSQLRSHLSQFTGTASSALFNAAQASPSSQMLSNMSTTMQSQTMLPRMQFQASSGLPQRNHQVQVLNDQIFNMGNSNPNMVMMQQQQHGGQSGFGNISTNSQNLQSGMVGLPNAAQNPNFAQQRQQNQQ